MIDIAEQICQAIDKIVQERLSDIKYDTTVAAIIVDNSHANQYYYTVSTGEAQFIAYSNDTSYKVDDSVLVTIPNNDYDQQKIIIGKNVNKDDNIPYILRSPFETLLDVTGNIAPSTELKGLIANLNESSSIEIFNWPNETSNNLSLDGYTRLGLKGQFSSWLDAYDLAFGEYGYELIITSIKKDINNQTEENITTTYKLNTYDMIGNPYRFNAYHTQEKVFDISDIGRITGIQLKFYQVPGSFVDKQGTQLTYNQILGKDVQPDANLFTKDAYISFGYDLATFQNEDAKLYSISPETYNRIKTEDENKKYINLRWIHKFENGAIRLVTENDYKTINELKKFEIKWYRYKLGAPSADEYSGVYWEEIEGNKNLFTYALNPDVTLAEEKIKVIIINDGTVVRSNIIAFVNEDEVVNNATIDVLQGLNVIFEDGSNGNYFVYGQNNHLFNDYEGNRIRKLIAKLKEHNGELTELTEFTKLTWRIPANNTMLSIPNTQVKAGADGYYIFTISSSENSKQDPMVEYCIKPNLNATAINNVIYCELEKNGLIYTAAIDFNFGLMGTNGTDVTLVIDFEDPTQQAIWPDKTEIEVDAKTKFIAHLYDSEHNEIDLANDDLQLTFIWDLLNEKQIKVETTPLSSESYTCEIANNIFKDYPFRVLRLTLKGWGDYDLIAYKPIALTTNEEYSYIGPSNIIYSTTGYIDYYKQPIKLYNGKNNIEKQVVIWEVNPSGQSDAIISKNNILQPSLIYIKNSDWYGIKILNENEVYWYQPLVILQNLYPSAVINKWNGKSVELNENEGYIISPAIAAGKKNDNNQFSGVMLGDWSQTEIASDLTKQTGLYGFHQGAVSFAFKEDGTAFIGKSGKGRIHFDGTNSTIRSEDWDNRKKGLFMDLDDGIVKLQSDNNYVLIWPRPTTTEEFNEMLKEEGGICYLQRKEYSQIYSGKAYNDELAYYLKDESGNYIPYANTDIDWLYNYWNKEYTALNPDKAEEHFNTYKQHVYVLNEESNKYESVSSEDKYNGQKTYVINDNNAGKYFYFEELIYEEINKPMNESAEGEADKFDQDNLYFRSEGGKKYITLSAETQDFPLAIGADAIEANRNFRVAWDGTCYITNGEIQGTINADYLNCSNGRIAAWIIEDTKLIGLGGDLLLDANAGIILKNYNKGGITLDNSLIKLPYVGQEEKDDKTVIDITGYGTFGIKDGNGVNDTGPAIETYVEGESSYRTRFIAGFNHIGMAYNNGGYISINKDGIDLNISGNGTTAAGTVRVGCDLTADGNITANNRLTSNDCITTKGWIAVGYNESENTTAIKLNENGVIETIGNIILSGNINGAVIDETNETIKFGTKDLQYAYFA